MAARAAAQTENGVYDMESARQAARQKQAALPEHDAQPVMALPDGSAEDRQRWILALENDIAAAETTMAACQAQLDDQRPLLEVLKRRQRLQPKFAQA